MSNNPSFCKSALKQFTCENFIDFLKIFKGFSSFNSSGSISCGKDWYEIGLANLFIASEPTAVNLESEDETALDNQTVTIKIAETNYDLLTDALGNIQFNHTLVANYELGLDNISASFEETTWYLPTTAKANYTVLGTTTLEDIKVEGDWFGGKLVRGGNINVTGLLVDDLGNRIEGNLTIKIGNHELNTTFIDENIFSATGEIPEVYRNNKTLKIGFTGTELLDGTSYKSEENVLVPSEIRFDFEPTNVFPGDQVNISLWIEEDDGTPLPYSNVTAKILMYYENEIEMDTILEYELVTDEDGFAKFDFILSLR